MLDGGNSDLSELLSMRWANALDFVDVTHVLGIANNFATFSCPTTSPNFWNVGKMERVGAVWTDGRADQQWEHSRMGPMGRLGLIRREPIGPIHPVRPIRWTRPALRLFPNFPNRFPVFSLVDIVGGEFLASLSSIHED